MVDVDNGYFKKKKRKKEKEKKGSQKDPSRN